MGSSEQYAGLSRAQLSFDYLHTNSTTHEFLFGAIAELIDNSRDAGATELDIYTIKDDSLRGGYLLCFNDNGCGMTTDETRNVIIFGRSVKRVEESTSIGMYGNGLKSGSMRIGNDMILFTKRDGVLTCLFLSRTFHEEEKIDEVVVPLPHFKTSDKSPIFDSPDDKKRHDLEMSLIMKYSPFRCQKDIFAQFDKIKGNSGTLVIIYNMKLLDNGEPEMDITTDPKDIILSHPDLTDADMDIELCPERTSLRPYVAIMYADPRMKVYLQGRKVQTKRLISNLYKPRCYNYASKTFKTRAEMEVQKAKDDVKIAEMRAKEAESKARDMENRYNDSTDPEHIKAIRKARNYACSLRESVKQKQNAALRKSKALKDPKTLTFYFGINLENRACDGMFVYNCSRLIKMYQRIGPQQDSGMTCRGVVGIVNVPYLVLEPTHNKQDFADAKEFRALMRAMADHLMQYWDDLELDKRGVAQFWSGFGYMSAKWRDAPSDDDKFAKKRALSTSICVQCDQCLKWRILPFQATQVGKEVPDNWQCKDNPDPKHKRCSEPEQLMNVPVGVLKRKIKTKEQRQQELEEQIRKKQEELEKMTRGELNNFSGKKKSRKSSSSEEDDSSSEEETPARRGRPPASNSQKKAALPPPPVKKGKLTPTIATKNSSKRQPSPPPPPRSNKFLTYEEFVVASKTTPPVRKRIQVENSSEESEGEAIPKPKERGPPINRSPNKSQSTSAPNSKMTTSTTDPRGRKRSPSPLNTNQQDAPVSKRPTPSESLSNTQSSTSQNTEPSTTSMRSSANGVSSDVTIVSTAVGNGSSSASTIVSTAGNAAAASRRVSNSESEPIVIGASIAHAAALVKKEPSMMDEPSTRTGAKMMNQQVEVRMGKQTMVGKVVDVKDNNRVKIKFDNMPDDSHDRWMPMTSSDIKLLSSAHSNSESVKNEETEKIIENFKVCLRYFLPPDWPIDKERIHGLSISDLADFPLDKFFDRYEHGLRKLLSNFQTESSASREKLSELRKNAVKLIQKYDKNVVLPSGDGEAIDKFIHNFLDKH